MELACDEQVIAMGASPTRYAQTLLSVARNAARDSSGSAVMMASKPNIQGRVEAIFANEHRTSSDNVFVKCLQPLGIGIIALLIGCQTAIFDRGMAEAPLNFSMNSDLDQRLKNYFRVRFERTKRFIEEDGLVLSNDSKLFIFFNLGINGEWRDALSLARDLGERYRDNPNGETDSPIRREYELVHDTVLFHAFMECHKALEACSTWDGTQIESLIRNTIGILPEGGILIADEKAGGSLMSLFVEAGPTKISIPVLDMRSLADERYFDYLRRSAGSRMAIPASSDIQQAYNTYMHDAHRRHLSGELLNGEEVTTKGDGMVSIHGGHVAAMGVSRYTIEWIAANNRRKSLYFAGSGSIPFIQNRLQSFGCLTRLMSFENEVARTKGSDSDVISWHALFEADTGARASRQSCYDLVLDHYSGGELIDKELILCSPSQKAWSTLRLAQALTLLHFGDSGEREWGLAEQQKRDVESAFLQAWAWDPRSELVVDEYLNFLGKINEFEWVEKLSSLSREIRSSKNQVE